MPLVKPSLNTQFSMPNFGFVKDTRLSGEYQLSTVDRNNSNGAMTQRTLPRTSERLYRIPEANSREQAKKMNLSNTEKVMQL